MYDETGIFKLIAAGRRVLIVITLLLVSGQSSKHRTIFSIMAVNNGVDIGKVTSYAAVQK